MGGLDRIVQLFRIGIVAHLLVGLALLGAGLVCGGRGVTPEAAATLYGVLLSGAGLLWAWPVALALWHQPALEALRRQRGGTLEPARWLAPSAALRFEDDHLRGRLEVHPTRTSMAGLWPRHPVLVGRVVLRARGRSPAPCRMFVRLARRPAQLPPYVRTTAALGDPELDSRVVFAAGSVAQAGALIAAGLRVPLLELYQLSSNLDHFEISYDGEALVITRSLMVRWQEDWAPWALRVLDRAGRRLLDVLQAVEPHHLDGELDLFDGFTLEYARLDPVAGALCLVCAERMETGHAAVCLTCETSFHLECWSYNGMCALFGCGSTLSREQVISGVERGRSTNT